MDLTTFHVNFLASITSSFAPASQQRIKRLKPTNTRLKQQFEEFWEPQKTQRGAGRFSVPPPFVVFSATQNCSDWCLSLVFVGFNLLILCWLAGANDEVHSFKFNPYFPNLLVRVTLAIITSFVPTYGSFHQHSVLRMLIMWT